MIYRYKDRYLTEVSLTIKGISDEIYPKEVKNLNSERFIDIYFDQQGYVDKINFSESVSSVNQEKLFKEIVSVVKNYLLFEEGSWCLSDEGNGTAHDSTNIIENIIEKYEG